MSSPAAERQTWMSLLARAPEAVLLEAWEEVEAKPAFAWLRQPEIGTVMVRGRAGATGAAFNLGEMTVTRCALRLEDDGTEGHAHVAGRSRRKAEIAALCDALLQGPRGDEIRRAVLAPAEEKLEAARRDRAEAAAATRVDFFTLVRGED